MSEPEVEWYIQRVKVLLGEIDKLIFQSTITNSIREIISFNTNEIEIALHTIVRKLKDANTLEHKDAQARRGDKSSEESR